MIPADVLNSLKTLALTQKPLITTSSVVSTNASFIPGQKYSALVQAELAPGIFKVQVADHILQLRLPSHIRSGNTISLEVISLLPRLTFNMAASANPLSTSDQLSETAHLLSSLTRHPLERAFVRPISNAPLWTGSMQTPDVTELAGKLHTALSQSGLFYESHQAQWLAGSRNTKQLMQEPQNLPAEKVVAAMEAQDKLAQSASDANKSTQIPGTNQARTPIAGIPDHLQQLVQQQLSALDTRQVQWQGQVWQNQEMTWRISEEDVPHPNASGGKMWSTQIHLDLPNLGEVTAKLNFSNNGVNITLDAVQQVTRTKLGAASSALTAALSERGINTAGTLVARHDEP